MAAAVAAAVAAAPHFGLSDRLKPNIQSIRGPDMAGEVRGWGGDGECLLKQKDNQHHRGGMMGNEGGTSSVCPPQAQ